MSDRATFTMTTCTKCGASTPMIGNYCASCGAPNEIGQATNAAVDQALSVALRRLAEPATDLTEGEASGGRADCIHGVEIDANNPYKCFMCAQEAADRALRWPDWWPETPSEHDKAQALAAHPADIIRWWREVTRFAIFRREHFYSWSQAEMSRFVALADCVWMLGAIGVADAAMARRAANIANFEVYVREEQALIDRLKKLSPRARKAVLGQDAGDDSFLDGGDNRMPLLRMRMSRDLGRRFGSKHAWEVDSLGWTDAAACIPVPRACQIIEAVAAEWGKKIARVEPRPEGRHGWFS